MDPKDHPTSPPATTSRDWPPSEAAFTWLARIVAFLWRGNDDWNISLQELKKQIQVLETDAINFPDLFEKAFEILLDVIRESQEYVLEVDRAFKSTSLDKDIDRRLYS